MELRILIISRAVLVQEVIENKFTFLLDKNIWLQRLIEDARLVTERTHLTLPRVLKYTTLNIVFHEKSFLATAENTLSTLALADVSIIATKTLSFKACPQRLFGVLKSHTIFFCDYVYSALVQLFRRQNHCKSSFCNVLIIHEIQIDSQAHHFVV